MSRERSGADESETPNTEKRVNLNRHRGQCSICSHEKGKEIEAAFGAWESPDSIVAEHGLALSMARRPLL